MSDSRKRYKNKFLSACNAMLMSSHCQTVDNHYFVNTGPLTQIMMLTNWMKLDKSAFFVLVSLLWNRFS